MTVMNLLVEQTQNLSNIFILPLIKRSAKDFEAGTFVNSYVDIENFDIVVEVETMLPYYKNYTEYSFSIDKGFKTYIFFNIPEIFHGDVAMFVDGQYSKFSDLAKTNIRKYSKLAYKQGYDGKVQKSVWLHVIDKSDNLRATLERQLGVTLPEYSELASKPDPKNFFDSN